MRDLDLDAALDAFVATTMVARDVAGGIARMGDFVVPDRSSPQPATRPPKMADFCNGRRAPARLPSQRTGRTRNERTDDGYGKEQLWTPPTPAPRSSAS